MPSSGLSKDRLDRLRAVMAGHVDSGAAPGAVWAVSRRGDAHVDALGGDALGGGRPALEDFLRERVLGPLAMKDTGFFVPPGDIGRFATADGTDPSTGALRVSDEPTGQWGTRPPSRRAGRGSCPRSPTSWPSPT